MDDETKKLILELVNEFAKVDNIILSEAELSNRINYVYNMYKAIYITD
jgi:hypothetical protein